MFCFSLFYFVIFSETITEWNDQSKSENIRLGLTKSHEKLFVRQTDRIYSNTTFSWHLII